MIPPQLNSVLSNYFVSPEGLLALLALIPLALFYFMKPEPEEKIMPSMAFFMEKKKSGKMQQAFSRLMANLLLLLHILFILGAAAAIAQPYIIGEQRPENAVIVIDNSASMSDDLQEAKQFAKSNLGKENTVIVSGENTEVLTQSSPPGQAKSAIDSVEPTDLETDIVSGLEAAQSYEGQIIIASDLANTAESASAVSVAESLKNERSLKFFDSSQDNQWSIVEVSGGEESYVEVENFMDKAATLDVEKPSGTEQIDIDSGEVERVELKTKPGKNTVSLAEDGFSPDNTAYISEPENRTVEIVYIGDGVNRYLREAVEAMEFTEFESVRPPADHVPEGDIYAVGETDSLLESTASDLQQRAKKGDSLVLFAQEDLNSKGFSEAPGTIGDARNTTVTVTKPRNFNLGRTEIYNVQNINGTGWAQPGRALVRKSHGSGNILLYNLNDEQFRYDFYYPVFWKEVFQELEDRRSASELNVETGTTIDDTELTKAGFHNVSGSLYAANLESSEESASQPAEISDSPNTDRKGRKQVQNLAVALLALLAALELAYLTWIGEV